MKKLLYLLILFAGLQLTSTPVVSQTSEFFVYLPLAMKPVPPPPTGPFDMVQFMSGPLGNGPLYEVQHSNGSQARHQTQVELIRFYHTKGENDTEWEELWHTDAYIFRGTDTSPGDIDHDGDDDYYSLRDDNNGQYGSKWAPRFWDVGDVFERNPTVTFYDMATCTPLQSGEQQTWLKFEAFYPSYTFVGGITLDNVVQLAWMLTLDPAVEPPERYFYAEGYGLVAWESTDGRGYSYINEIHDPGQRPDNIRKEVSCLDTSGISPLGLPKPTMYVK